METKEVFSSSNESFRHLMQAINLSRQGNPTEYRTKYLGVMVTPSGSIKKLDSDLKEHMFLCMRSDHPTALFYANLPNSALRSLYRTNIRIPFCLG